MLVLYLTLMQIYYANGLISQIANTQVIKLAPYFSFPVLPLHDQSLDGFGNKKKNRVKYN